VRGGWASRGGLLKPVIVCVFITAVPITKLFAWGERDSGGHVLRETTNIGLSDDKWILFAERQAAHTYTHLSV
jgi:hypothetical protein